MTDEIEAVARAIAPYIEGDREYDHMPANRRELKIWSSARMCSRSDATQESARDVAQAIINVLDKHRLERAREADPVRDTKADSDGDDGA